jgi:hypothetical protein
MRKCLQEECENWSGEGCVCVILGIEPTPTGDDQLTFTRHDEEDTFVPYEEDDEW